MVFFLRPDFYIFHVKLNLKYARNFLNGGHGGAYQKLKIDAELRINLNVQLRSFDR